MNKFRNPKFEYRNPKQIRMTKIQMTKTETARSNFEHSTFGFWILNLFWISILEFRISKRGSLYLIAPQFDRVLLWRPMLPHSLPESPQRFDVHATSEIAAVSAAVVEFRQSRCFTNDACF